METLARAANRGSISTAPYEIENSLKFESDNVESLTKSQTASNRKTWTVSFWFKRTKMDSALQYVFEAGLSGSTLFSVFINGTTDWRLYEYVSNSRKLAFHSTVPLNDSSAWYHMVIACDTTQSSAADRFKIYLNGVNVTAISGYFSTAQYPTQNYETHINSSASTLSIGKAPTASTNFCGYISEFNFIDGLMKEASDFGKYDADSGIWIPKEYTGSYGNEGYFLNFQNSSNLGADSSGNGNNFTQNNIAAADQATDTPTNNFCTWNPLWAYQYQPTIKEGATVAAYGDSTDENAKATIGLTNGKWYWEAKPSGTIGSQFIGISTDGDSNISSGQGLTQNYQMTIEPQGRYYSYAGSLSESSAGQFTALTTSDTLGIALDMDSSTQTIKYYANGSLILTRDLITEMQGRTVFPFLQNYESRTFNINFGGYTINTISSAATDENGYGTFEHAPPSGYYSICSQNLALYGG